MAAAHVPLGRRCFSLGDSHAAPLKSLSSIKIATISRLISAGHEPAAAEWIVANRGSYSEMRKERKVGPPRDASANVRECSQ
jgi:hypothetical protein